MAGYRLRPVAARRRRNPWQRQRRAIGAGVAQSISIGVAVEVDTAVGPVWDEFVNASLLTCRGAPGGRELSRRGRVEEGTLVVTLEVGPGAGPFEFHVGEELWRWKCSLTN